ncbi:ABC transporter ATP-binding protein [Salinisphaera orenii]|uniref:ABC transporter ATP-binding protein n=1 Tax=Salinisphaera orenii TaxID=856731 RepID=UPI000DBE651A
MNNHNKWQKPARLTPANADHDGPLLAARGLSYAIAARTLWHDLNLDLVAGERLAVTGRSGSGKSLLLQALAGLDPLRAGDIHFQGQSISAWSMPAYRSRVVYLPQRPELTGGTVMAALRAPFGFRVHRTRAFPTETAEKHLAALGLDKGLLRQRADRLSGGETQIIAALRALLIEPRVLLLDEPAASMDVTTARRLETLIEYWRACDPGRACIWTSHDRHQLERVTDRQFPLADPEHTPGT